MANAFLNAQEYSNVMLLLLKNTLVTGRLVDGQFKDQVTDENGLSINVKRPPRFVAKSGATLQTQDIVTGSVNVAVNQYSNVHIGVGDLEYVQSFNALMKNETMKSAAVTLATKVDSFLQGMTTGFNSWVADTDGGLALDPTKPITSPAGLMPAHTRLMDMGCPNVDISGTVTFTDGEKVRGGMLSNFTPQINVSAMEKVRIPVVSEIDWYATQQCPTLTTGTRVATSGLVNGSNQNVNYRDVKLTMVSNLIYDGFSGSATIKAGEVFTIAGVYAWDWRSGQALPFLQQFTVTANVTSSSGAGTLVISPPIIVQGTSDGTSTDANTAFATVDSVPLDDAALTFVGAASTNLKVRSAWQKRAISLVSARLQMPFTGVASYATDPDTGISIRYWRGSDITTGQHVHRWDMIYGGSVMDPFLGTRIGGAS
jgi:hypothetical protein